MTVVKKNSCFKAQFQYFSKLYKILNQEYKIGSAFCLKRFSIRQTEKYVWAQLWKSENGFYWIGINLLIVQISNIIWLVE